MTDRSNSKPVYHTTTGRLCSGCGWPERDCKCSSTIGRDEPVPPRIVAKLRMAHQGRGGKAVPLVNGLPRNAAYLRELAQELKRVRGTGGTAVEDGVELQGDLRDRVRDVLQKRRYVVKG